MMAVPKWRRKDEKGDAHLERVMGSTSRQRRSCGKVDYSADDGNLQRKFL